MSGPQPPRPFSPTVFAETFADLVLAHKDHGGWMESDDGLRCAADGELVCPTPDWLRG